VSERRVRTNGRPVYGQGSRLVPTRPSRTRTPKPRLNLLQRRLLMMLVAFLVVLYGVWKLVDVTVVVVNAPSDASQIQQEALQAVHGSWQQDNLLTLSNTQIASDLQQANPLILSATVRRKWFHTVVVNVLLKQPSLGWSSDGQRYLLDSNGSVIGSFPAGSVLPVVNDGSNLPVTVGQAVVPTQFVAFVSALVPALASDGYTVTSLDVKDTTLDLDVSTNKSYKLIFDTSRSVPSEIHDLKAVQGVLTSSGKTPASYIDLRISGRAYWE
jgi:cell division septal protein FtsQ